MTAKEAFLNQFDSLAQSHLLQFANRLTDIQADVFLLMARKAACLVDVLEGLRLTALRGVITTDRVLDMERSWLRGKRVVIVDDAIISGTTLFRTIQDLKEAGVVEHKVLALCVDRDYWNPDLVQPLEPYLELSDQETTSLCSNIVDALSVIPRPYSVDYPLYSHLALPDHGVHDICSVVNWTSYDVTSSMQSNYGVFSVTMIPNDPVTAVQHFGALHIRC